jgi:lipopolysaccharide biosynthesis glycosyltransferase/cephalosporin hydroxylase
MDTNNCTATWIINESFLVPAYISIASFKKHVNIPVIIYYSGELNPTIESTFKAIGSNITVLPVEQNTPFTGAFSKHIQNRFTRFDIAERSSNQTMLMIDADTAFTNGIEQLITSIEKEKSKDRNTAMVWGVVEFEHAADAWLYFNRKDDFGNDLITPPLKKQTAFAEVFGPDWRQLLDAPQFNNGILAFHNCGTLANVWKKYYLKGLANKYVNPMDDQVPLAATLASHKCKTIPLPNTFNSKGWRSGNFSGYHLWAGRWKTELLDLEEGVSNLSDYAKIAQEFWNDIPNLWKEEFIEKAERQPNQFREIKGVQNFESVCENVVSTVAKGHVVEVGTYLGKSACFLAELVKNSGKQITIDTIDNYQRSDISRDLTISNLKQAEVLEWVNVIENDVNEAAQSYTEASLDLILLDADHNYSSVIDSLNHWYPKLKPGGTLAGVDYSLPEKLGSSAKSAAVEFCKKHQLTLQTKGVNFVFEKPTTKIPLKFHFCWFSGDDLARNKPFSYVHYLCLLSAIKLHKEAEFNFYCNYEIESKWFNAIRHRLNVVQVEAPTSIYGQPLKKVEHRADIFRFRKLLEEGGIYLDLDVFCKKPFTDLLNEHFVMGIEAQSGLCNAVILAEPKAPFLSTWLESYHPDCKREGAGFDPDGWAEMSVHFPQILAKEFEEDLTIMPPTAFFHPIGTNTQMEILFNSEYFEQEDSYCHHLWESQAWEKHLKNLTPEDIITRNGYFFRLVKTCLTEDEIYGVMQKTVADVSV